MMLLLFLSGYALLIRESATFGGFLCGRVRALVIPRRLPVYAAPATTVVPETLNAHISDATQWRKVVWDFAMNAHTRCYKRDFGFLTCLFLMKLDAYALTRILDSREY